MQTLLAKIAFIILLVVFLFFGLFALLKRFKSFFKARFELLTQKVKRYVFLFRWFLIGKYHCDFKNKCTRSLFASLHKGFWLFVIFSCVMTLALFVLLVVYFVTGILI